MKSTQFFYNVQDEEGAQIGLVIERGGRVVHLCEMKFYQREYLAAWQSHLNLENKIKQLSVGMKKSIIIQPVSITAFGLEKKEFSPIIPTWSCSTISSSNKDS